MYRDNRGGNVGKETNLNKLSTCGVFTPDFIIKMCILCLKLMERKMSNNRLWHLELLLNIKYTRFF